MILHDWGEIEYTHARERMQEIHTRALYDKQNHLILCSHPNVFTVGSDTKESFDVRVVQSDRGGSITCHTPGQSVFYFCFLVQNPAVFYKKVLNAFEDFFMKNLSAVTYNKGRPGFYIQNRKIASLGFRYSQGVSLHGVALNVDVDLNFHSQVSPCNLEGIVPTSLKAEGVNLTQEQVNDELIMMIKKSFGDAV
ncbi:lipoyl(octanoyl) transferase LipB [Sulfurimonas paralvinellae]|uniref:Octanoyltransferase n=1 Tax=Sulfurimonas paralvinellae TaxID=317658 RepID=A0A7M1B7T3_9BACT|nr:lipoyl(octanoyl) transferase LipB [Sulfurimonas paralvinellae]QOP45783.1 lipoyl(octanoyl) transferase LipB [Sulfurimonas paralvinellae]